MHTRILMVAITASIGIVHPAHAASEAAPEHLLKSAAGRGHVTALQQDFRSGPETTKTCLSCHTQAAMQKLIPSNRRTST